MKATEQTIQKLERFIKKIAEKFPPSDEPVQMTDIRLQASQDSGELLAFDDDDREITRCVVDQWIDNKDDDFYDSITATLRKLLEGLRPVADGIGLIKPYSFILDNEDKEDVAELYVADDDTVILGGDLMEGLDEELDRFFSGLMSEA